LPWLASSHAPSASAPAFLPSIRMQHRPLDTRGFHQHSPAPLTSPNLGRCAGHRHPHHAVARRRPPTLHTPLLLHHRHVVAIRALCATWCGVIAAGGAVARKTGTTWVADEGGLLRMHRCLICICQAEQGSITSSTSSNSTSSSSSSTSFSYLSLCCCCCCCCCWDPEVLLPRWLWVKVAEPQGVRGPRSRHS
jgi:hypothetical protein